MIIENFSTRKNAGARIKKKIQKINAPTPKLILGDGPPSKNPKVDFGDFWTKRNKMSLVEVLETIYCKAVYYDIAAARTYTLPHFVADIPKKYGTNENQ